MNTVFHEASRNGEFYISTDLSTLPLSSCPFYIQEGIVGVCQEGSAQLQVFNTICRVVPEVIFILLPWQLTSIKEVSDDFRITFFIVSQEMFTDSLSTLWRITPEFFFYMHKHFVSKLEDGNISRFLTYCDLLNFRAKHAPEAYRRESIMQLLRVLFWDVYVLYDSDPNAKKTTKYTRKEELAFKFMRLIIMEHAWDRNVAYYAEKLHISPKYLTTLIRSISGQSARDWIVYYTIIEIKSLLRGSSLEMKEICKKVNCPDQSILSRFFRRYTGMSPSDYRKNIHS